MISNDSFGAGVSVMTAKQTKAFILLALSRMQEVLEQMSEGEEKEKLQKAVELLECTVD